MGKGGETKAMKDERRTAEQVAREQAALTRQQNIDTEAEKALALKKKNEFTARKSNMLGGSRTGLMYNQNQAGVV